MMGIFNKKSKKTEYKYGWFGDYKDWSEVSAISGGYESGNILQATKESLLKIKNGEAVYERDSVLFDKKIYPYSVISSMLYVAVQNNNVLNVIDFGGSLGSTWFQIKDFIPAEIKVSWSIVEQAAYTKCGKEFFEDEVLKFYNTIDHSISVVKPNVLLLSSVVQYLEKPYEFLKSLDSYNFQNIIIDRTAFIKDNGPDRLTLQIVPPEIYEAQYPSWFFNEKKFLECFKNYNIKAEFESYVPGEQEMKIDGEVEGYDKGFYLEKK